MVGAMASVSYGPECLVAWAMSDHMHAKLSHRLFNHTLYDLHACRQYKKGKEKGKKKKGRRVHTVVKEAKDSM